MSLAAVQLRSFRRQARRAFTLIEVLVVVALLAIMASLVAPTFSNASTPMPQTLSSILEIDMRRASIEAIGRMSSVALVVGGERDRWWIEPVGPGGARGTPIDGTTRLLGNGALGPFAGYRLDIGVNGEDAPAGSFDLFIFDTVGGRDERTISVGVLPPNSAVALETWNLEPQRTKFTAADD